jgi:hypothetical protein
MKTHILVLFLLCFVVSTQAQEGGSDSDNSKSYKILSSNVGASGSSNRVTTNKGTYYVSQSIGQGSVIGTSYNKGYYLLQGYQQVVNKIKVVKDFKNINDLSATVFPNPFEQSVSISFSQTVEKDISVSVFDVAGKLMYSKTFSPAQSVKLNLDALSSGTYLLKATSNNKLFNAKILKI